MRAVQIFAFVVLSHFSCFKDMMINLLFMNSDLPWLLKTSVELTPEVGMFEYSSTGLHFRKELYTIQKLLLYC